MPSVTLGIDVGTSSVKAVVADVHGAFFATATASYHYESPAPGAAEQDASQWWYAVCDAVHLLIAQYPDLPRQLCGIAVSGQGVAAVLMDEKGEPLRPAMLWLDTRPEPYAAEIAARCGNAIARISGKCAAAYNVEPKLLWLREHEPDLWRQTRWFTTTTGYITHRMTGRAVMNHSDAGILLGYDLKARCWCDATIAAMGLPRQIFCELADCDTVVGGLTERAALELGLAEGCPVMAGGEDTSSAGLAMGATGEGDVQLSMGMACTVYTPSAQPAFDSRLLAFPHVIRGLTLVGGSMVSGGVSLEWALKLIGEEATPSIDLQRVMEHASAVPAGAGGVVFLPYLAGELQPVNDGSARGVFAGLHLGTTPAALLRAVMEGTAFGIRHNLDVVRECGAAPIRMFASGGPSRNDLWCQIIADISGLPVHAMNDTVGAALGDAILAARGVGLIENVESMQAAHAEQRRTFLPDARLHSTYDGVYDIYRQLYPRLRDLFPMLHTAAQGAREGETPACTSTPNN